MNRTINVKELNEDMAFIYGNYQSGMSASYNKRYTMKSNVVKDITDGYDYNKARSVAYSSLNNASIRRSKDTQKTDVKLAQQPFGKKLLGTFESIFNGIIFISLILLVVALMIFALKFTLGIPFLPVKLITSVFVIACGVFIIFKGIID